MEELFKEVGMFKNYLWCNNFKLDFDTPFVNKGF